jgi:hypothetical protein
MKRNFTLLLSLVITCTLPAQKPESVHLFPENLKSHALPPSHDQFHREKPSGELEQGFYVKSGMIISDEQVKGRAIPGLALEQELKSAAAARQRLDSIVSTKTRTLYEYDADGRLTSQVEYVRDTTNQPWIPSTKEENTYDEQGRWIMLADYTWDDDLKQWVGDSKTVVTRDEDGTITQWDYYDWDPEQGDWFNSERLVYTFDEDGNETDFTIYEWDPDLGQWIGTYTEHYNYDENGWSVSSSSSWTWDTINSQFKPEFKMEITRDAYGMITNWVESKWDPEAQEWVFTNKGDNIYDEDGNNTSMSWAMWDTTANEWVPSAMYEYTFDQDGNQTSYIQSFWNADSSQWLAWQKYEYTYDANGYHILTVVSNWDPINQEWYATSKTEYTYNEEGDKTSSISYQWDLFSMEWVLSDKEESTYNEMGYMVLSSYAYWNADSNKLIEQIRVEYTYDANGFQTSYRYYGWNYQQNRLMGLSRYEYTRDEYGNTLSQTNYMWDPGMNDWMEDSKYEYVYDYDFTYADLITPFYMQHKITGYTSYVYQADARKSSQEWVVSDEFSYYYTELAVSAPDLSGGELTIFPNPATDYMEIEEDRFAGGTRVVMYNVAGRMVLNELLEGEGKIAVSHLAGGIYVVRLVSGSSARTGKIMIQ